MRKQHEGAEFFLPFHMIDRAASFAAGELREDQMLRGLDRPQFIERLSYHYDQWNYIHPFREGNGRAQRLLWNRIAADAGWNLDWRSVHGEVNNEASRIATEQRDLGPLCDMFTGIVTRRDDRGQGDVERLGIRPPGIDPMTAARIAGMDTPAAPRAVPPAPQTPNTYGSPSPRSGGRHGPDAGLGR
ncbi:Fic family protein [Leucobacter sp. wl10]|uniref:Fic family protein n=1 Tax=Leucobacter sp. wl10 TaxID=2304677 RepID=UPI001F09D68B|nr:Fic family protein [Leucobacter sp. wl10]